ncbi:hypothetical protein ACIBH1_05715 [Nonomuraea sp. NPDC050663]|uniref:hypothetical protein n=1 Tax=Nonomuraea sp. NPDC050663 TaxID=3364370 RepID=UPI0037B6A966
MVSRTVVRRGLRLVALAAALVVLLAGLVAGAHHVKFTGDPEDWAKSTGNDALWMGHMWVDGRKTEADVADLAVRLSRTGIKDLYVHTGPFNPDGTLDLEPRTQAFTTAAKSHGLRVSAWLGQAVDGILDLDDAATRANILTSVQRTMALGFDGIHYNFEPIGDGDAEFLDLLERTRAHTKLLSTSTPQIEPYPGMRLAARVAINHDKYWSAGYFSEVVERVDQVAIMTYDSFMPAGSLYGGHVVRQAERALDLVPEDKLLLIGAPAYHDHAFAWSDASESVATAARAARLALSAHGRRDRYGLALYVDFAATEQDWHEYTEQWFQPALQVW